MKRSLLSLVLISFIIAFLSSCNAQMTITLTDDEAGSVSSEMSIIPALQGYWKDLADLDPKLPKNPLDPVLWRDSLKNQGQIESVNVQQTSSLALRYSFKFKSLTAWTKSLTSKSSSSLFSTKNQGANRLLTVYLDRKNLGSLMKLTLVGQSSAAQTLLPAEGTATTRDDYLDALEFLLEPYDPKVKAALNGTMVTLVLNLPRPVIQAPGAVVSGKTATYKIPLLDILALETPKTWKILY